MATVLLHIRLVAPDPPDGEDLLLDGDGVVLDDGNGNQLTAS